MLSPQYLPNVCSGLATTFHLLVRDVSIDDQCGMQYLSYARADYKIKDSPAHMGSRIERISSDIDRVNDETYKHSCADSRIVSLVEDASQDSGQ